MNKQLKVPHSRSCFVQFIANQRNSSVQSHHHPYFTDKETKVQRHPNFSWDHTAHEWQGQDLNPHLPGSKPGGKEKNHGGVFKVSIMKPEPVGVQLLEPDPPDHCRSPRRY